MALYGFTGALSNKWTDTLLDEKTGTIAVTNWTDNALPSGGDGVVIGGVGQSFDVVLDSLNYQHSIIPVTLGTVGVAAGSSLTAGAGAKFTEGLTNNGVVNVNSELTVGEAIANDSSINVTGMLRLDAGALDISGDVADDSQITVSLTGLTGNLRLIGEGHGYTGQLTGANLDGLTILENFSTISGAGRIGTDSILYYNGGRLILHNHGTVNADSADGNLVIAPGTTASANALTNDGMLEATGSGQLVLSELLAVQSGNGTIGAFGDGAEVVISSSHVAGGTLDTSGTGVVRSGASGSNLPTVLDSSTDAGAVTNKGHFVVSDGTTVTVKGGLINSGTVTLDTNSHNAVLAVDAAGASLQGGGKVVLHSAGGYVSQITGFSTSVSTTLVNMDNTISGGGKIGVGSGGSQDPVANLLDLDNRAGGVINANLNVGDEPAATLPIPSLVLNAPHVTNAGLLEATGTGGLMLSGNVITQSGGGRITADGEGAHVDLQGATIRGGALTSAHGGFIGMSMPNYSFYTSTLDGGTEAGAITTSADIKASLSLQLKGVIHNSGTITTDGNSANIVIGAPDVTLDGGGTIVLQHNGGSTQYSNKLVGADPVATLHNVDNTISGAGMIGYHGYDDPNRLAIDNQTGGVINATGSTGDGSDQLLVTVESLANAGLIEATGTDGLTIQTATMSQAAGGRVLADGADTKVSITATDFTNDGTIEANGGKVAVTGHMSGDGTVELAGGVFKLDASATTVANAVHVVVSPGDNHIDLTGGSGDDVFRIDGDRSAFVTADGSVDVLRINGGTGNDTLLLDGDYADGFTFSPTALVDIERIQLGAGHSYALTTDDANLASGATLAVDGSALGAADSLTFNGGAETGGSFLLSGGAGDDVLTGGARFDTLVGGAGNDVLDGGANPDNQGDIMLGGAGDDTYYVDSTLDLVDEGFVFPDAGWGGTDTIISTANWYWDVESVGEIDRISEDAADPNGAGVTFVGGIFDNTLIGHSGTDILFGRGGNDIYIPGDGVDWISLSTLGLTDQNAYAGVDGHNTIIATPRTSGPISYDIMFEFDPAKDKVDVSAYHQYASGADVLSHAVDDGAGSSYIALGDGLDYLYFVGLTKDHLLASDFVV